MVFYVLRNGAHLNLYEKRLVLFSGKGGVGKTTIATAFAMSCAQRGMKTLLMQINAKDRIGEIFDRNPIGEELVELGPNLFCVNSTPASALREYALMTLKIKIIYRAVFENKIVQSFLNAIPGISELVLLGKAYYHAAVEKKGGELKWDIVVVDAPATGHGIFLLKIPSVVTSIIDSGHMFEEAERMKELLEDSNMTSINIVTLLEDLPINESQMLLESLGELNISVDYIFMNRVLENPFSADEGNILEGDSAKADSITDSLLLAARFRKSRLDLQNKYLDLLKEKIKRRRISIPYFFEGVNNQGQLEDISQRMQKQLSSDEQ